MALTEITSKGIKDADIATADIADNAITLAKMAGGTDGQIITYDASGNPTAVGPGTDGQVLTSTGAGSPPAFETPAAGVGGATGVDFNDDVKIRSGTGNDLEIYHNGSNGIIDNVNTLLIKHSTEHMAKFIPDDAVELYFDNAKKLETTSGGISVTGGINLSTNLSLVDDSEIKVGTGDDLKVFHQSSYPRNVIETSGADFVILTSDHDGTAEKALGIARNGGVELYHDNALKAQTIATGVNITGGVRLGGNNAANEMDDYEEGTFLPTIYGNSAAGTTTYHGSDNRRGHYTKVGRKVTVHFTVGWNENSGGSGDLMVGGLPFTVDATSYSNPNGTHQSFGSCYFYNLACPIDSGSFMHMVSYVYGGIGTAVKFLQMQISGDVLSLNMTYGGNESASVTKYIGGTLTYHVA